MTGMRKNRMREGLKMDEKIYKTMNWSGTLSIVVGIISIVAGVAGGVLLLVSGAKLLTGKARILF